MSAPRIPNVLNAQLLICALRPQLDPTADIPLAAKPKLFTPLTHVVVVLKRRGKTLMLQNNEGRWWSGLWDFPRIELTPHELVHFDDRRPNREVDSNLVEAALAENLGLKCRSAKYLLTIRHGVTRYRIALHCFAARLSPASLPPQYGWKWVDFTRTRDSFDVYRCQASKMVIAASGILIG